MPEALAGDEGAPVITLAELDEVTPVYRLHMRRLSGQQQRVVASLAMLGGSGVARDIARDARLGVSGCSSVLTRLCSATWPDVFAPSLETDDVLEMMRAIPRRPWCRKVGQVAVPSYGRRVSYELVDQRLGQWCRALRRPGRARRLADAGRLGEL